MISLKNEAHISKMRDAGKILREVEDEVRLAVRPGVTTAELDVLAERLIRKHRAIPSSLHYQGYPCSICASINDEVVHGIPSDGRVLKEGDIVSIDCTLLYDGWQSDSAFTVGVGRISPEADHGGVLLAGGPPVRGEQPPRRYRPRGAGTCRGQRLFTHPGFYRPRYRTGNA